MDIAQKALSAWIVLGVAALAVTGISVSIYDGWSDSAVVQRWVQSEELTKWLLLAVVGRYLLLGYVAAWIDTRRPLLTLLVVAALDAYLHTRFLGDDQTGLSAVVLPALVSMLVMLGGVWRVCRGPEARAAVPHAPTADRGRSALAAHVRD